MSQNDSHDGDKMSHKHFCCAICANDCNHEIQENFSCFIPRFRVSLLCFACGSPHIVHKARHIFLGACREHSEEFLTIKKEEENGEF